MLEELLYPESVAIVGASNTPGKVGHDVLANLIKGGFGGEIIPVNPKAAQVQGLKAYANIRDYDGEIDLAVIIVPSKVCIQTMDEALDAGARSLIVISAGFKETGDEGAKLEEEMVSLVRSRGVRMMGPNSVGLLNTHHDLNVTFAPHMPKPGGISVISQSGALCTAILDWAVGNNLGLGKLISIGNKADLSEIDFLKALCADESTRVIVGYLESIDEGDEFIKVAETAAAVKPVVILKVGVSKAGIKAASSHTGSLAGADIAYGAAFKRAGVIRAETFESLFDTAIAFDMQPLPTGKRVAIITNAGGAGIIAADAAEGSGLVIAQLEPETSDELRRCLPPAASVGNPVDVLGDADAARYAVAVGKVQEDRNVDAVIILLAPQSMTNATEFAKAVADEVKGEKPVLAALIGGKDVLEGRKILLERGIPNYPAPERAVAALKSMVEYNAWRQRPARIVERFTVNRRRVERVLSRILKDGRRQVGEVEAKEILRAYDFGVPEGHVARTSDEAVDIAKRIGFPVAMKIVSPQILHKSDFGGVKVNLGTAEAVRDTYDLMILRIPMRVPDAVLEGVLVERMAHPGREVIMGMSRDPQFGPMLMFGLGGIFVEVMKDVAFYIAPITADEAMQMLEGTKSYALLKGARGESGVDLSAIARGLQRISQLVTDFPIIQELDINPYIVGPVGTEPVVADARMILAEGGELK